MIKIKKIEDKKDKIRKEKDKKNERLR